MKEIKSRWQSICYAWSGVRYVLSTEPNARIHVMIALLVVAGGLLLRISRIELAVILIMISVVWGAELSNTAVEVLVDYVSPEKKPFAEICKDVSAAAVLTSALISILVGLLIFGPRVWYLIIGVF